MLMSGWWELALLVDTVKGGEWHAVFLPRLGGCLETLWR